MKSDFNDVEEELNQIENEFASGRMNAFGPASTQEEFLRDLRRIAEIETQVFYKMCSILKRGKEEEHGLITNMFASAQPSLSTETPQGQHMEDGVPVFEPATSTAQTMNSTLSKNNKHHDERSYSANSAHSHDGGNSEINNNNNKNSAKTNSGSPDNPYLHPNMTANDTLRSIADATSNLPFTFPSRARSPQNGSTAQKSPSPRGNSTYARGQLKGNANGTDNINNSANTSSNNNNNTTFDSMRKGNASYTHPNEWPNEAGFADKAFENVEAHFAVLEGEFSALGENLRQLSKHVMRLNEMSEQVNNMT